MKSNEMIHVPGNRVSPSHAPGSRLRGSLMAMTLWGAASAAWAVNDLPGGPAVRQLDLHPAVTRIASAQQDLHHMMMYTCIAIFVAVFGGLELLQGVLGTSSGVAHFAHLGGMLGGWLMMRYWRGQPPFGRR